MQKRTVHFDSTADGAAALRAIRVACASCTMRGLCMPAGLDERELARLDELVGARQKVRSGTPLFRQGQPFSCLYAIRSGFFKTCVTSEDGRGQVTGFQMAGELLGLDGVGNDRHDCDSVALEDAQVCMLPFARLSELSREIPALQQHLHRMMSREIVRERGVMLLLGSMRSDERLAAFLLNLAQRLQARGFSGSELVLRMTREEIGSYLGLQLETVSRTFTRLAEDGLLEVRQRRVRILDAGALRELLNAPGCG
jgi:CRP/FNR family transcriptional regulator